MSSNSEGELIVAVLMLGLVAFVIYIIVVAALYIIALTLSVSATFGGGVSLYNYGTALKNNVKPEK